MPPNSPLRDPASRDYLKRQQQQSDALMQQSQQNAEDDAQRANEAQRQQERQARETERQQEQQQKETLRAQNVQTETQLQAQDRPQFTDAAGVIRPQKDDATFAAEQATKNQAKTDALRFQQEGRKFAKNPIDGSTIPLQSDAAVEAARQAKAEAARRSVIDRKLQALRTEADDPALASAALTEAARVRAEKALTKKRDEARYALQAKLSQQAAAKTGTADWVPFNEVPTPEAQAAAERLKRLEDPNADLEDDDLALLDADPTTASTAAAVRNLKTRLAQADEAGKKITSAKTRIWEEEMRRDNPAKYRELQRQKLLSDPNAIEGAAQDFEARKAALETNAAEIATQRDQTRQQIADIEALNTQRMAEGVPAADLIQMSGPDGQPQPWSKELAAQRATLEAQAQAWEGEQEPRLLELQAEEEDLKATAALINEAQQGRQQQAESQRQQTFASLAQQPGGKTLVANLTALDAERAQRMADLQKLPEGSPERQAAEATLQGDLAAKAQQVQEAHAAERGAAAKFYRYLKEFDPATDWTKPDRSLDQVLRNASAKSGIDPETAKQYLPSLAERDWTAGDTKATSRVTSDGQLLINPTLASDAEAYKKAVESAKATPEAKQAALAQLPAAEKELAAAALPILAVQEDNPLFARSAAGFVKALENPTAAARLLQGSLTGMADSLPSFNQFVEIISEKQPDFAGKSPADQAAAYLRMTKGRGVLSKYQDQILSGLINGTAAIPQQIAGAVAALTGNESAANVAATLSQNAQIDQQRLALTGANDAPGAQLAGSLASTVPSLAVAFAGGMVGQTLGRVGVALRAASKGDDIVAALSKGSAALYQQAAGVAGSSVAGGLQSLGGFYADAYQTFRERGQDHLTAHQNAAAPAMLAGMGTALLTLAGGATGVEKVFAAKGGADAVKAAVRTRWQAIMGGIVKEAGSEGLEEGFDQLWQGFLDQAAVNPSKTVKEIFAEALEAGAIGGILGGAIGGIQAATEAAPVTSAAAPNPANLPETVAAAEEAIDGLDLPDLDPQTVARTQEAARSVLYIAQGSPLTDLPADSLAALDIVEDPKKPGQFINGTIVAGKDGGTKLVTYTGGQVSDPATGALRPVRVRIENGQPIISQTTLDKLETILPAVRAAIPLNENDRKNQVRNPAPAQQPSADAQEASVQGAGGSGNTQAPSNQAAGPAAPVAEDSSATDKDSLTVAPVEGQTSDVLPPEAEERANQLSLHLAELGLPPAQAETVARAMVAKRGVVGTDYTEQVVSKDFTSDLKALGISGSLSSVKAKENPLKAGPDLAQRLSAYSPSIAQPSSTTAQPSQTPSQSAPVETQPALPPESKAGTASDSSITAQGAAATAQGVVDIPQGEAKAVPADASPDPVSGIDADAYLTARQAAMKAVPVAKRKDAVKLLGALDKAIDRYGSAFSGVRFVTTPGGGLAVNRAGGKTYLDIDLGQWVSQHTNLVDKAGVVALTELEEEFIHRAASAVFTDADMSGFFRGLPADLQRMVYKGYHVADIASKAMPAEPPTEFEDGQAVQLGHEFLRMLVQDSTFNGRVSEAIAADPSLGEKIIAFLQKLVGNLRKLIDKADPDTRVTIAEYEKRVTNEVKRLKKLLPDPLKAKETPANLADTQDNRASVISTAQPSSTTAQPTLAPILGATYTAFTDSNDAIEVQWAVVDVNSIVLSNEDDGRINPAYPQELQPRDRTSAGSEAQVADIAKNFNLDRLSASNGVGDGAPIIGPDGIVESGNGRGMGARRAYATGKPSAKTYRQTLLTRAPEFGLNAEQVEAVQNPVLVRIRRTDVNRPAFVLAANVSTIAPKRDIEQAKIDAGQIVPDLFESYIPSEDGDIFTAANADFIKGYISTVIPPAERPAVIDARGNLSQAGLRRIRNALFVHSYGTSPEALNALARLTESVDAADTNIARALIALAPRFGEQNARIAAGALQPVSITDELTAALQILSDLKNRGEKVSDWLAQDRIPGIGEDPGPVGTALVEYLHENRQRPRQIIDTLARYASAVDAAGDPRQMSMFDDEKPTKATLWARAAESTQPALAKSAVAVDPRLAEAFPDSGFDAYGFPNPPVTLPDDSPLLEETLGKTQVQLPADHPLVAAGMLPAGRDIPRQAFRDAIGAFLMREASPVPAGTQPTVFAMGGGGGAGKSTILGILKTRGDLDTSGAVEINSDDIKLLIPEYHAIVKAGDWRGTVAVHEESSTIAKAVLAKATKPGDTRYNVVYDATLADQTKASNLIKGWKNGGYRVHLIGVTIEPREAITRAFLRGKSSGRWVPSTELIKAHSGFNSAVKAYIPLVDAVNLYDNTPPEAHEIAVKTTQNQPISIVNQSFWSIISSRENPLKPSETPAKNDLRPGNQRRENPPNGRGQTALREVSTEGQVGPPDTHTFPDGYRLTGPGLHTLAKSSVRAYHGTPHKVDKFRLDKIGSGEGVQAFGWGLYFAQSLNIANWYRKTLASKSTKARKHFYQGSEVSADDSFAKDSFAKFEAIRTVFALTDYFKVDFKVSIDNAKQHVLRTLAQEQSDLTEVMADDTVSPETKQFAKEFREESINIITQQLQFLETARPEDFSYTSPGNLYTVELLGDPETFLDWDKPLSEQGEKGESLLETFGLRDFRSTGGFYSEADPKEATGKDAYFAAMASEGNGPNASAMLLKDFGIKGIRYLDGHSRGAGEGTRNYVIFDEALVRILEENGQPVDTGTTLAKSKVLPDAGPDLFGFNTGMGLDALLTPAQKEAKVQQAQTLDLFGGLTNEKPRPPAQRPTRPVTPPKRQPAPQPEADGFDGIITTARYGPSEIVDLTTFDESKAIYKGTVLPNLPRLTALHNLSAENLLFADEMGGLAVPSIAVTTQGNSISGFGDITLIGTRDLVDPRYEPVFDADAYSPRFPDPEYTKAKSAEAQKLVDALRPFANKFDDDSLIYEVWDNAINRPAPQKSIQKMMRSPGAKAAFLAAQGVQIEPVMRPKPISAEWATEPAMDKWRARASEILNVNTGDTETLAEIGRDIRAAIESYSADSAFRDSLRTLYLEQYLDENDMPLFGRLMRLGESLQGIGQQVVDAQATSEAVDAALTGKEAAFKTWVDRSILSLHPAPHLTVKGRKQPYTLPNIVEAMTGRVRGREDTMTTGAGQSRAKIAKRFKELEEMRLAAAAQIVDETQVSAARENAEKLLSGWRDAVSGYTTMTNYRGAPDIWAAMDGAMSALARWAKTKRTPANMAAALRSEGFAKVPEEIVQQGQEAAEAWLNSPVPYFEAKPQRAVSLNEFAGAVIPEDSSPEVLTVLERNGIRSQTYERQGADRDTNRTKAIEQLAKTLSDEGQATLFKSSVLPTTAEPLPDIPNWRDLQTRLQTVRGDKEAAKAMMEAYHRDNPGAQAALDARKAVSAQVGRPIPPAWTEVQIYPPGSRLLAKGRDDKGRLQSIYSSADTAAALASKFERAKRVNDLMPRIIAGVKAGLSEGTEEASVLRLIYLTGFRNGGEGDTGAKVKAYGATTLLAEHVNIEGDVVTFDFIGKLGVQQQHTVIDAGLAEDLRTRKANGGRLFNTSPDKVLAALRKVAGTPDIKVHDLRTWNATSLAAELVKANAAPETETDYWLKRDAIGDVVARKLGDTRKIVLESYIDPIVFAKWQESVTLGDGNERPKISRKQADARGASGQLGRPFQDYERSLRDELLPPAGEGGWPQPDRGLTLFKSSVAPSSYDTAPPDPFTGIPSLITGPTVLRDQGRAIAQNHAQRLRAGLRGGEENRDAGPALAKDRSRAFVVPVLSAAQMDRLQSLPPIGEGAEAKVYADRGNGTVYKVLQGFQEYPALGIWPDLYSTADGKLDYTFSPATRPRQLGARIAVQTLLGGTPTEIVGIGPDGHVILKQPLSSMPDIASRDAYIDAGVRTLAKRQAGLVLIPPGMLSDPKAPSTYLAVVEGRPYLVADLVPDNFVGDTQRNARLNDVVVTNLPATLIPRVKGLAAVVTQAGQEAARLGDRANRLFASAKRVEVFDKNIKTPYGSRYYHLTHKGDWFEIRLADHSNTSAQGRQDSSIFDNLRSKQAGVGMDSPHRLNVVLTDVVQTEKEASKIIRKVLEGLPDAAIFRQTFSPPSWAKQPDEILGNDTIEVRFHNGTDDWQWEYTYRDENDERHDDEPPQEKAQSRAESGSDMPGRGPTNLESSKTGQDLDTTVDSKPVNLAKSAVVTQAGQEAARLGDRANRLFKSSVASYREPVVGTNEMPPRTPQMDDFMVPIEQRKTTPGFLKDGWALWHEALDEWKPKFAAWVARQPSLAAFLTKPTLDKDNNPRFQRALVVSRISRPEGGWRMTYFSRYLENKPDTSYGDFADGAWVPTSHSEYPTKEEAFDDALSQAGQDATYTTQPLFKSTVAPTTDPSPLAKLGWNHLDRMASAKIAAVVTQAGQEAARLGDRANRLFASAKAVTSPMESNEAADQIVTNERLDEWLDTYMMNGWEDAENAIPGGGEEIAKLIAQTRPRNHDRDIHRGVNPNFGEITGRPLYSFSFQKETAQLAGGAGAKVTTKKGPTRYLSAEDIALARIRRDNKPHYAGQQAELFVPASELTTLAKSTVAPTTDPSPLAKLGWNHLDRSVSAKLAALTRWTTDKTHVGELVAKWGAHPNAQPFIGLGKGLKRELFPDSVLPREVAARKREMEIKTALGAQRGMDLVRALSGKPKFSDLAYPAEFSQNPMHRRNLYLAMTGEIPMTSLPQALQDLGGRLRDMLVDMGREAVKQGRMSTDTFANLQSGYMPHYYKEDVQREKSIIQRFRLGVRDILAQRTTAWHIVDNDTKDKTGEPRLISWQGNQWRFRNKEHRDAFYEDFILNETLSQVQARGGKAARALTLSDLRAPAKLDAELRGRIKEISLQLKMRYSKERPLDIDEQEKAGLIMDPVYSIARYTAQMVHDNSTAEFFNFVAGNKDWTSDTASPGFTEIPDNPRFGRLAGKYVTEDVSRQILEMVEAPNIALQLYDTLLGWWKTGKTVLNPGTHMRNVLGNVFFSQLAGTSVWNPGNVPYYKAALKAMRNGGPDLQEAYEMGVLGADFVSSELRQTLRQLLPDPATIADDGKPDVLLGIGKAIGRVVPDLLKNPLSKGYNQIAALYQAEDELFKLATYLKAKAMTGTPEAARDHVRTWFPYFDQGTSATLKTLGRTAMPFLGFYRESIRIFGNAVKERPIALATGLAVPSLITFLSAMLLGLDDDDVDQVKKDMRGKAGKLLGPTPFEGMPLFSMLLPVRSDTGQVQQFDISAIHPFVDFLGNRVEATTGQDWYQQMWRSMLAAGPVGSLVYSQMTGKDTFGDRTFVEENMTAMEKIGARADNLAKTLLPPLAPGGTGFKTLMSAGERTTNKTFEVRSPVQAVTRAVIGLDVRNATPDLYRMADDWRKANGLPTSEGMDFGGSTPVSRARKALFAQLAQDEPNPEAIKNIKTALTTMGSPIKTPQDVQRLLFYRNPLMIIGGDKSKGLTASDAQQRFRNSLKGLEREALDQALAEYEKIKAKAPALLLR